MDKSVHLVNGHYRLRLRFRHNPPKLPDSFWVAKKRLGYLKRKMEKIGKTVEPTQVSPELYVTPSSSHFTFNATVSSTTHSLLCELSEIKASGFDSISIKLLKDAAGVISHPLSVIFNNLMVSCRTGEKLPRLLKFINIMHKKTPTTTRQFLSYLS